MKKTYQKPLMYIEDFRLMEHIASCFPETNAELIPTNVLDPSECHYTVNNGEIDLFYDYTTRICSPEAYTPDDDGDRLIDILGCYTTYSNTSNLFAS